MPKCPECSKEYKQVWRHFVALGYGDDRHDRWVTDQGISTGSIAGYNSEDIRKLRDILGTPAAN